MWNKEPHSLPSWVEDGYEILVAHIDDPHQDVSRERAHELLLANPDFEDEPADAEYAVKRLLERGWLYEVDEKLRVTEPDG